MKKEPSTFRFSPKKVVRLLNIGMDMGNVPQNTEQEKADLLSDRLNDMLPLYYSAEQEPSRKLRRLGQTIAALAGEPIGKLLQDPKTDIAIIRMMKDYGRKLSTSAKSEAEHHTANTIYYAAIAHALDRHDLKITKFSYQNLLDSFRQLSKENWIPKNLRDLFVEALKCCEVKLK
jgi:hypothetical protein